MFSYYGSKSRIQQWYPLPQYDLIIEPFAGSAKYSCEHHEKQVWLNDVYSDVYDTWKWLIEHATKDDLEELIAHCYKGNDRRKLNLVNGKSLFYAWMLNQGSASPRYQVTDFAENSSRGMLRKVQKSLHTIKHWQITNLDYRELPDVEATWFIDPPYQFGGEHYVHSNREIDFAELAEWCKSRKGQVIVCENNKANWLPFKLFMPSQGRIGLQWEMIYYQGKGYESFK